MKFGELRERSSTKPGAGNKVKESKKSKRIGGDSWLGAGQPCALLTPCDIKSINLAIRGPSFQMWYVVGRKQ